MFDKLMFKIIIKKINKYKDKIMAYVAKNKIEIYDKFSKIFKNCIDRILITLDKQIRAILSKSNKESQ